ncbi:D-aminoacyl-tRNA deacylase [Paenibacillus physcomitrellae]|uniref:D-aminoacyl-tRNA deacylase n=1 Tax=Paenibacillus physcomitrellae TaxID=1619311 RepID=A0ABQ1GDW8_9BACL|nr:D-aminoacyl-tRNA deacylase [Paenibacillus physcomitrellae]GGA41905.1 putative D-aminoacyl-tRNA deacylase-like protein [Paenibacillus physcomitrellae]
MRVLVQRCKRAQVTVEGEVTGRIGTGLMLLVGITHDDQESDAAYLVEKISGLRIFDDEDGKMNLSVLDIGGSILSVSQFTLYGDTRKGKRPSYSQAAGGEAAEPLYNRFNELLRAKGLTVETGRFGADMDVELVNWGPVTLWVESPQK